jgi:hypothetical protein
LLGRWSLRLGSARPAVHRSGADRPLGHSGGGGGAARRELEPTVFSRPASRGWHDDDTSAPRAVMTRTTSTYCSSRPRRWRHHRSTTARATGPHRRRHPAPLLSASCCGCRCDCAWRSGVSHGAPYAQHASSPLLPGSG